MPCAALPCSRREGSASLGYILEVAGGKGRLELSKHRSESACNVCTS